MTQKNKQYLIHVKETRQMFMVVAPNMREAKKMVFVNFGIKEHEWLDVGELDVNLIVEMNHMGPGFNFHKIEEGRN